VDLRKALAQITQNPECTGFFVIVLVGVEAPYFCTQFLQQISRRVGDLTYFDVEQMNLEEAKAELEISFLGMRRLYVLRNFSQLDAASKKVWISYLQNYHGPHGLFITDMHPAPRSKSKAAPKQVWADSPTQLVIELPDILDKQLYAELFAFFYPTISLDPSFVQQLMKQHVSLDEGCLMMAYQTVVGKQNDAFFEEWYPRLVMHEASLFSLSQYFFARNAKLFLEQWKASKDAFPVEFWTAYWSQQLWQAAQFVAAKTSKQELPSIRLPFSFINTDWKQHSLSSLVNAHNSLYELDYALKNGGTPASLELWYHQCLTQEKSRLY